jgi:hypothetical protein
MSIYNVGDKVRIIKLHSPLFEKTGIIVKIANEKIISVYCDFYDSTFDLQDYEISRNIGNEFEELEKLAKLTGLDKPKKEIDNGIWLVCSECGVKEFVPENKLQEHTNCLVCKARMVFAVDKGIIGNNIAIQPENDFSSNYKQIKKELEEIKIFEQSDLKRISRSEIIDFVIDLNLMPFEKNIAI